MMRLVQNAVCRDSRPSVLTEVLFTGLVTRLPLASPSDGPQRKPDAVGSVLFDFLPGMRELLLSEIRRVEVLQTASLVADYVLGQLSTGHSPVTFAALIAEGDEAVAVARSEQHFATVTAQVLRHLSGQYESLAERLDQRETPGPDLVASPTGDGAGSRSLDRASRISAASGSRWCPH
ncbi:hypothetical protein ACFQ60_02880 [Streptomyces zhihengii]